VPLATVADFEIGRGPTAIARYDRTRRVTIEADMVGNHALGEGTTAIYNLPTARNLPPGVTLKEAGDVEVMGEVFSSFALAMGAGLMMVYGVLILLFASFTQPCHDPVLAAALHRRRHHRAPAHRPGDLHAGRDRHPDADGDRDEKRDHAGRFCRRGNPPRR
jgi:hypothetical protein